MRAMVNDTPVVDACMPPYDNAAHCGDQSDNEKRLGYQRMLPERDLYGVENLNDH
jgi:hypothetical protein